MTKLSDRFSGLTPLQRAVFALKEKSARLEELERAATEPIAIVGIACRFPGGVTDTQSFWDLLCAKRSAIREIPPDRWDVDAYYDPNPKAPGKMNTRFGGFLDKVDLFDNDFFGVSEREACGVDPQQRLLLELAWEALEDAGIAPSTLRGSDTGVYVGISGSDYGLLLSSDLRMTDAYVGTGSSLSIAANRISFAFDFHGPSLAVDTACSSALVATHLACRSLRSGESDMALVGGSNMVLAPTYSVNLTKVGFSAADGCVRAFDAAASGYVRSEGCGIVVLKRLSQAVTDGDSVYAVIRGSAINEDGFSNGLSAPNRQSQEAVLRAACRQARVAPGDVQYVECHGTGTLMGDTIEAMALGNVIGAGRDRNRPCLLSAVKTNLGHMEAAAGIASLIKAALVLKHRRIPATVHYDKPNPNIPFESIGLKVVTELSPWPDAPGTPTAGVSAFGFGGSNAHLILQAADASVKTEAPRDHANGLDLPILCLSARSANALKALVASYLGLLRRDDSRYADICYAAGARRDHHDHRLAIVASSPERARTHLQAYLDGQPIEGSSSGVKPYGRRPRTVFMFANDVGGWIAAARRFAGEVGAFRGHLLEWDERFRKAAGFSPMAAISAGTGESHGAENENGLLLALQGALADTWKSLGVAPDTVVGFGRGGLAAACAARALEPEDAVRIAAYRDAVASAPASAPTEPADVRCLSAALPLLLVGGAEIRNGRSLDASYWLRGAPEGNTDLAGVLKILRDSLPDCLLEVGPPSLVPALTSPFATLNPHGRVFALGSDGGASSFAQLIAELYAFGHNFQWQRLACEPGKPVSLPSYPWQRRRFWIKTAPPRLDAESRPLDPPSAPVETTATAPVTVAPDGAHARPNLTTPYEAPRTELECLIVEKLEGTLNLDCVGLHDNFFELGGESLQAASLINQLQKQIGETLHVLAIFEAQTAADLAEYLRKNYPAAVKQLCPNEVVGESEFVDPDWPLSITLDEVEKARVLIESYAPREEARAFPDRRNRRAVFILSPPRSGTTLMRVMLAGSSKLFAPPELELLPFDDLGQRTEAYAGMAGLYLEGTTRALMEVRHCQAEEAGALMRGYEKERMTTAAFYRLLQDSIGDRLLVDKTPSYAVQMQNLRRAELIFDEPLYVHLLRHPCGMIRSFLDYKMDQNYRVRYNAKQKFPFSSQQIAELVWTISHQNILKFLSSIPSSRQMRVSFENLVRDPEAIMHSLSRFLEVPYVEAMADPYRDIDKRMVDAPHSEGRMQGDQNLLIKHKKIDPAVADRWSRVMTSEFLGEAARALASEFGYTDVAETVSRVVAETGEADGANAAERGLLQRIDSLSDNEVDSLLEKMLAEYE
jgi:acyl transferase domain-containing protein